MLNDFLTKITDKLKNSLDRSFVNSKLEKLNKSLKFDYPIKDDDDVKIIYERALFDITFFMKNVDLMKSFVPENFTGILFMEAKESFECEAAFFYFKDGNIRRDSYLNYPNVMIAFYNTRFRYYWFDENFHLHNYQGPAKIEIERANGRFSKVDQWYLYGNRTNEELFRDWCLDNGIKPYALTPEDETLIKMKWG